MIPMKVMTVIGTRPEIIRLSRVMVKLDENTNHIIVHTGQNYDYELNEVFFNDLEIRKPDYFLGAAGESATETIGNIIIEIDKILALEQPEALLILGDTNSCLSVIAAKRRKIPVFHMEAGNRCFDERVPEEINRRIVDHSSDINLPYSSIARDYLIAEGIPAERIIKTGSPMFEILSHYGAKIDNSCALAEAGVDREQFFLVSVHRQENVDEEKRLRLLNESLNAIAEEYMLPVLVSTHPRTRARIESFGLTFHPLVQLLKPFGFLDYIALQKSARAVLSDSGTISEESSILNFPALNLRDAHERPEAFEEGSVMMTGLGKTRILQGLEILKSQARGDSRDLRLVADYSIPNVSDKVLRIILSYVDFVRKTVWREY